MSENGWTNDFLCTQWFWDSFIPQAKAKNTSGAPILLIYDGHGSHTTDEMRKLAEEHNIELFCLLPHTTHRMQPLDVGVFGPLQWRWQEHCDEVLEITNEEIRKVDFVKEYMAVWDEAFLPETITKAWKKSGIYPLNPNIFTDADFSPSASTSRHACVPGSYPAGHDSDDPDFLSGSDESSEAEDDTDRTDSNHSDEDDANIDTDDISNMLDPAAEDDGRHEDQLSIIAEHHMVGSPKETEIPPSLHGSSAPSQTTSHPITQPNLCQSPLQTVPSHPATNHQLPKRPTRNRHDLEIKN